MLFNGCRGFCSQFYCFTINFHRNSTRSASLVEGLMELYFCGERRVKETHLKRTLFTFKLCKSVDELSRTAVHCGREMKWKHDMSWFSNLHFSFCEKSFFFNFPSLVSRFRSPTSSSVVEKWQNMPENISSP